MNTMHSFSQATWLHRDTCGACSNTRDIDIYNLTRHNMTTRTSVCAIKYVFGSARAAGPSGPLPAFQGIDLFPFLILQGIALPPFYITRDRAPLGSHTPYLLLSRRYAGTRAPCGVVVCGAPTRDGSSGNKQSMW